MALTPLATIEDLEAALGESVPDALLSRAGSLLTRASTLVRSHTGRSWVDAEGELEEFDDHHDEIWDSLVTVTTQVAERAYRNPTSAIQTTDGPFSDRYAEKAGEGMWLTDAEKSMLATAVGYATDGQPLGVWTLGTTRGDNLDTKPARDYSTTGTGDPWTEVPWPS